MSIATTHPTRFPNYQPVNPNPTPRACSYTHCDQPAVIDIYAAAGPECGAIRPHDPEQVLVVHPCCSRHATRLRHDTDAFGPAPDWSYERFACATEEVPW